MKLSGGFSNLQLSQSSLDGMQREGKQGCHCESNSYLGSVLKGPREVVTPSRCGQNPRKHQLPHTQGGHLCPS